VPQISIVTGLSAGGGAYSPALTDWVVMTEESSMFLTGPGVVREALGEDVNAEQLGGTRVHQRNGVCHFVAADDCDASRLARDLLGYLPSHRGDPLPRSQRRPAGGGDLGTIRRRFPEAPQPWLDLSTGINPIAYPVATLPAGEVEAFVALHLFGPWLFTVSGGPSASIDSGNARAGWISMMGVGWQP